MRIPSAGTHTFTDVTERPAGTMVATRSIRVAVVNDGPEPLPQPDGKPPYRVPGVAEIAGLRGSSGYRAVSTFSGCGGSCLGMEWAGFDVIWASEFVPAAADTYRANHPGVPVDSRDIRTVTAAEVLNTAGVQAGEVDVFEGSPPCSGFSTAGKRHAGWGQEKTYSDTTQERVEDLFFDWVRLLDGIKPRAFIAENVRGLAIGTAKGYLKEIIRRMKACGYRARVGDLDAQWLGVPQRRRRLIFVGFREDLCVEPTFPKPLPYRYSVADACPWIVDGKHDQVAGSPVEPETDISRFAIGREARMLPEGGQSDRYFQLVRADRDKPCPTVTFGSGSTSIASVVHPTEVRRFSIAELRRICGFPDDFVLTGTYSQQWERLARAVPPPMMRAVAAEVRARLEQVDGRER